MTVMAKIREKALRNLGLKLLALALAILLWLVFSAAPQSEVGFRESVDFGNLRIS